MTIFVSITSGQETQYRRVVEDAARKAAELALTKLASISRDDFQNILAHGDEVADAIIDACVAKSRELSITNQVLLDWTEFYREEFGIELDCTNLVIPTKRQGFDRLLVLAAGLSIQQAFDQCRNQFGCWEYTGKSLDQAVPTNDRDPKNGVYAIWVRDRVEADEEHKNRSARQLVEAKVLGITLLERIIYELKYWKETRKHLDIQNYTLCSGSRYSDGSVPSVYWNGSYGKLSVDWYNTDNRNDNLRSREVVAA